jgi:hypothetical protein
MFLRNAVRSSGQATAHGMPVKGYFLRSMTPNFWRWVERQASRGRERPVSALADFAKASTAVSLGG